jgi:hypothetical protein
MSVLISVDKLVELCNPFPSTPWGVQITLDDIRKAVELRQFKDAPIARQLLFRQSPMARVLHIQRIAYLATFGWDDPIEIDVGVPSLGYCPDWIIVDGNHRYVSAICRQDKLIAAEIGGDIGFAEDLLDVKIPEVDPS